jgi:hypothetical protein
MKHPHYPFLSDKVNMNSNVLNVVGSNSHSAEAKNLLMVGVGSSAAAGNVNMRTRLKAGSRQLHKYTPRLAGETSLS